MAWRKYSEYTDSVNNVREAIVDAYDNFEILRAQADMQGKGPLLLNGDCAIDQPNAGGSVGATSSIFARDGLILNKSGAGAFSWQRQSNSNLLTARNPVITCDRFTVQTAAASPGAGDYYTAYMPVEGRRASRLNFGTARARKVWLCATARASIACTLSGALKNSASDRSFPFSFALAANTTTDLYIPITGCTDGTWLTDTGVGLYVQLALGLGSTFGGVANAWANANKFGVAGAGLMASLSATLEITAWELVISDGNATPTFYNPPDPTAELLRCQREYWKSFLQSQAPASAIASTIMQWTVSRGASASSFSNSFILPSVMRPGGALVTYNTVNGNAQARDVDAGGDCSSTAGVVSERSFTLQAITNAASQNGNRLQANAVIDARLS